MVKPITEEDDYDIDLVMELDKDYGLTAKEYKQDISKKWLTSYKEHKKELEEKRRCWHVEYDDIQSFHMDVIPAYKYGNKIRITDRNENTNEYSYIESCPKDYITWFYNRCDNMTSKLFESYTRVQNVRITEAAEIQDIKRHKIKNPLQKAIIILKRHRDLMFKENEEDKPISIIITTLAALSYKDKESICDILDDFFSYAKISA